MTNPAGGLIEKSLYLIASPKIFLSNKKEILPLIGISQEI